jgi:hypothetical protein
MVELVSSTEKAAYSVETTRDPHAINMIESGVGIFSPLGHAVRRRSLLNSGSASSLITFPAYCCRNVPTNDSDCFVDPNGDVSHLRTDGCVKRLAQAAVLQSLAIAVINSLLLVIALAAAPLLNNLDYGGSYYQKAYRHESNQHLPAHQSYAETGVPSVSITRSVVNPHVDHPILS